MILIGGSPSTGSSLLVRMLNRHSEVFGGSETFLFSHSKLFQNWQAHKNKLINPSRIKGLKSEGWFMLNGVHLLNEDYKWNEQQLIALIAQSADLASFANAYFGKGMLQNGKKIWVEKTPSNTNSFQEAAANRDNKVVHIVRNPYDTIASIIGRGYSTWYAVGAYVINTAMALRVINQTNYHLLTYENLILETEETLKSLCAFIDIKYETEMLSTPENIDAIKLPGWQHDENGPVAKSAKGKFEKLPEEVQARIILAMNCFEVDPVYANKHKITHLNCEAICESIGYSYQQVDKKDIKFLKEQRLRDWWQRTYRLYPTGGRSYPALIK